MKERKTFYPMLSGDTNKLFTWRTVLLAVAGLAINILLANFVKLLNLPLYIDNVGSVLVGALGGPIPGMTVGFLSNLINSFGDPITMYYGILTIVMAMLASFYTQKGMFRNWKCFAPIVISFILIGGGIGSIMTWCLYGGGIGGLGGSLATNIHHVGIPAFLAQILADTIIDIPDKTITVFLVILLLKFCAHFFKGAFPLSAYYDSDSKNADDVRMEIEMYYRSYSVKTMILRLIITCSVMISVATTVISFLMYCSVASSFEERLAYLIQMISVTFAISLLICAITIWFATKRIAEPITQIVKQSRQFRDMPSEQWLDSKEWKNRTVIKTGDEIEELYKTVCAEQEEVAENVKQMKETQEKLRHSKELEDALVNARQASQAKGQFLSRMSHEIRTPLNAVIGYMSIAKDSMDQPEKMLHCVENSEMAAKHLLNIINDVLDISSIESGKMKIANEEFNLKEQLTTITTLFYNQAKEKNVHFDTVLRDLSNEWVIGDSLRMNQILMNLLSNAVKFTPEEGQVTLTVDQMKEEYGKVFLKFVVSDSGIGMSEEFQQRLFNPFEQESATTAQKYGGTGLGLSITGNLISMMGGAIEVKSKQGQGTTFTVTMPFEIAKGNQNQHVEGLDNFKKLRALIVDDNEDSCEYARKLLKRCSIKSDSVTSGKEAILQLKKRENSDYSYDFCIMDWNMPEMNGIETAKKIRKEFQTQMPILIATAYDVTDIEDEAKEAGVSRIITKPLFQSTIMDFLVTTYGKYDPTPDSKEQVVNLTGIHILLAEDNPMNREIAVDILQKSGIIVDTAENGKEAVDSFTINPDKYQAILMDIQMPVMDGYEATRTIRALTIPEAKTVPIIAMTANAFHEDVAAALACGMNNHISKPIDYKKLFSVLQKL